MNSVSKPGRFRCAYLCMAAFCVLVVCFLAGGCGQAGKGDGPSVEGITLDVREVGETLFHDLEYRDQLEELPPSVVFTLLGIEEKDVAAQMNYFSSGATAEEILVFQAQNEDARETLAQLIENRNADQSEVYASYAPEEVRYLHGAVLAQKGEYLIYCVSADHAAAEKLINGVLGNT